MNLLSVDWDYFFHNPLHNAEPRHDVLLYDWGHREAPFFVEPALWYTRAASFLYHDEVLPMCNGFDSFWDQFRIFENAPLYIADSHSWAGNLRPTPWHDWGHIWNFDAHHDCGYHKESRADLAREGQFTCENWMVVHKSKRHVRYPRWFTQWDGAEPRPRVAVDRKTYDPDEDLPVFHAVFLCRSGAWVPSWCDEQFNEFLNSCPVSTVEQLDQVNLNREFDFGIAYTQVGQMRESMRLAKEFRVVK